MSNIYKSDPIYSPSNSGIPCRPWLPLSKPRGHRRSRGRWFRYDRLCLGAILAFAVSFNPFHSTANASPDSVVVFNEIHYNPPGSSEDGEWIEFFNQMGIKTDVSGWRIEGVDYTFPSGTIIDPGQYIVVYKTPPAGKLGPYTGNLSNNGETLRLINQSDRLMDELAYDDNQQWPIAPDGAGVTLSKIQPYMSSTPVAHWTHSEQVGGTPEKVNFPDADTPPSTTITPVFSLNKIWRYNESGDDLGTNWAASAHEIGGNWESGEGVLGNETGLPETINTTLDFPPFNTPYVITYYFETDFTLTAEEAASLQALLLRYLVDDGAIFYLNGVEVLRVNMPGGVISATDFASTEVEASLSTPTLLPPGAAVAGTNRLSVEVHQAVSGSSDVVFGAELTIETLDTVFNATPDIRFNELPSWSTTNYWIELINTGVGTVDIGDMVLSVDGDPLREYIIPSQTLSTGQILTLDEATLGFRPLDDERWFLYDASRQQVIDARQQTGRLRGRLHEEWLFPDQPTPGAANTFALNEDIVISEIAYNPPSGTNNGGSWIELANRSNGPIDLAGWNFDDGIQFTFPSNSVLAAGEHACIADDTTAFTNAFPSARLLGNFAGNLSKGGERLLLRDANNNPADEVHYFDGGRWPDTPDGGGASLELRDLRADNSVPESWASSIETDQTAWNNYTYSGTASASRGPDSKWSEFNLGLLSAGEILIDDIHVIENGSTEKLTNTDFSSGDAGWRFRGNHRHSEIIDDPDNPGNPVLRLVATGPTEHMHNQVETTLLSSVVNGQNYEISFRARWVRGSNQLYSRLYFSRLPMVNLIARPSRVGTPSAPNSRTETNIGPSITDTIHSPAVPDVNEPVIISSRVNDPDAVSSVELYYSVGETAFQSVPMGPNTDGLYQASIPGQAAATIVQFYVEATDSMGATATFPAAGPESRALYKVDDGLAASNGQHNFRILMLPSDTNFQHLPIHVMSNERLRSTVIDREKEIYYDTGVRLKSSQRGRNSTSRVGFNVRFNADQLYRGIHGTVAIDRSDASTPDNTEILFDIMIANSGGLISRYYDFIKVLAPQDRHTKSAVLQMARYGDVFLDAQFEDGSDGNIYEYELIYAPNTADANGYKIPNPDGVNGVHVGDLGDSKEEYRWFYLKKNNREDDDFSDIITYNKKFSQNGTAFESDLEDVIDIDAWLRGMAYAVLSGAGDNAAAGSQHNANLYARPDGRVIFFPHDMDFSFSTSRSIFANRQCNKLTDDPARLRLYLGHLHDIITTTYNNAYMSIWTDHLNDFEPKSAWANRLSHMNARSANVLSQINNNVAPISFSINTPNPLITSSSSATLTGDGWIDIRDIQQQGGGPLDTTWTDDNSWSLTVPILSGTNTVTLETVNFSGEITGSDTITIINSRVVEPASSNNLAISELMYHPADRSADEINAGYDSDSHFEFVELMNIGGYDISLAGVQFTSGINHPLPAAVLSPGERVVLARVRNAFMFRYPSASGALLAGEYFGAGNVNKFSNSGEQVTLSDASGNIIRQFTYDQDLPWPTSADGPGFSLELIAPMSNPDHALATNWRSSGSIGGTPGTTDATMFSGDPNGDDDNDGISNYIEYAIGNTDIPALVPGAANYYHFDVVRNLLAEDVMLAVESSTNLDQWGTTGLSLQSQQSLGNGLERQSWLLDTTADSRIYLRFVVRPR